MRQWIEIMILNINCRVILFNTVLSYPLSFICNLDVNPIFKLMKYTNHDRVRVDRHSANSGSLLVKGIVSL